MKTKVTKRNEIPAGILSGTEVFTRKGQVYAMREGRLLPYEELPASVRAIFSKEFNRDRKLLIEVWGKNMGDSQAFKKWITCKFGALDGTADVDESTGTLCVDGNSFCGDCYCAGAGKLCQLPYNMKPYEVATIQLVHQGFTRTQIAEKLFVSPTAIKSRLEKSKQKFEAHNVAQLVSSTPLIAAR